MTKTDVIKHYGGVIKAAKALDVSKGAISQWPEDLPPRTQCFVEVVSGGALKADKEVLPKTA